MHWRIWLDIMVVNFILQGVTTCISLLIVIAYTKKLDFSNLGSLAFVQSTSIIIAAIIDYGFSISSIRLLYQYKYSKAYIEKSIIYLRILISIPIALLLLLFFFIERDINFLYILFLSFLNGNSIGWLYISRNKYNLYLKFDILSKLLILLLIFTLDPKHYYNIVLYLIINLFFLNIISYKASFSTSYIFTIPNIQEIRIMKSLFKRYQFPFINVLGIFYNNLPLILISVAFGEKLTGLYSISEKIIRWLTIPIQPARAILLQKYIQLFHSRNISYIKLNQSITIAILIFTLINFITLNIFSDKIFKLIFSKNDELLSVILLPLSFSLIFIYLNEFNCSYKMYVMKMEAKVLKILASGIVLLALSFLLVKILKSSFMIGFPFLLSEFLIFILSAYYTNRVKLYKP